MYAIVEAGGKQYRVQSGDRIRVEQLHVEPGSLVELDRVLLVGKDDAPLVGDPYVSGASVTAKVRNHGKEDKVIVFKPLTRELMRGILGSIFGGRR